LSGLSRVVLLPYMSDAILLKTPPIVAYSKDPTYV
jgi:hypothetical protein